jgi:hypothetical protein
MRMKKALTIPAVIVVLLVGCRSAENREQLKAVNQSLEYANGALNDVNRSGYEELMTLDPDLNIAFYNEKWKLKAIRIKSFTDSVKDLIKNIKSDLIKQSDDLKKEHVPLMNQLYDTNGLGNQLLDKLVVFRDSCPAVIYTGEDSVTHAYLISDFNHYLNTAPLLPQYGDSLSADQQHVYKKKWLEERFGSNSTLVTMIMLNKIESDMLTVEKRFIDYCKSRRTRVVYEAYTMWSVIATVSSSYVKAGQSIKVYAGLGSFTVVSKPRITIDGKEVAVDSEGVAEYQLVATGKPGEHAIPVTIEFSKVDGSKQFMTKKVKYIIAEK